jgi:hypothetical protein
LREIKPSATGKGWLDSRLLDEWAKLIPGLAGTSRDPDDSGWALSLALTLALALTLVLALDLAVRRTVALLIRTQFSQRDPR